MEELRHYSHPQHNLKLITELHHDEAAAGTSKLCDGCRKPLNTKAGDPYFGCEECGFYLHRWCAELPKSITLSWHCVHKLIQLTSNRNNLNQISRYCIVCVKDNDSFVYYCKDCRCYLHILCAFPKATETVTLDHPCHHEHPLTLLQRRSIFTCNACWKRHEDESYVCAACQVWIHKKCALLPEIYHRKDHDHPLYLAYSVPIEYRRFDIPCDCCFREIAFVSWVYHCILCRYIVHIGCIGIYKSDPAINYIEKNLMKLPSSDFEKVVRFELRQRSASLPLMKPLSTGRCGHRIVSVNLQNVSNSTKAEIRCYICTQPIVHLGSTCKRCNYFFHYTCSQLPKHISYPSHDDSHIFELLPGEKHKKYIWSKITCAFCKMECNGFFYNCTTCEGFSLDIKCAYLPCMLMHRGHNHVLHRFTGFRIKSVFCWSCGKYPLGMIFTCLECQFYLDYDCLTFPESVNHKWDKHPLLLSIPPFSDRPGEFFCEVCEGEIHPRRWHYHCKECDQSFHPHCIPKILYRNCIFEGTLECGKHPHPLQFVREGDYHSRCDSCRQVMFDKRVFECQTCHFCICLSCVIEIAGSGNIAGPSKISE